MIELTYTDFIIVVEFVVKNNMSEVKLIPEDFQAHIPVHAADLGRWLRQNSVREEVIAILVGECVKFNMLFFGADSIRELASVVSC